MNEPEELGADVHPIATLLPWYLTGTLKEDERRQVVQHLEGCQTCRVEFDELTKLRGELNDLFSELPMPSPRLHQAVMEKIHAQEDTRLWASRRLDAVEGWFRSLYRPRWLPALIVVLVLGQMGILVWLAGQRTPSFQDGVISRGVPMPKTRIRVAFVGTAPEHNIRTAIEQVQGRIVDGPSPEGFYTIEVPGDNASAVERRIETLRAQRDLVRVAEPVKP